MPPPLTPFRRKRPVFSLFFVARPSSSIPQEFLKPPVYPVPVHK
jgi:hypothetical protein